MTRSKRSTQIFIGVARFQRLLWNDEAGWQTLGMEREGDTREQRSVMKKNVLFIQGGGEGAYDADKKLAESLQEWLGSAYQVHYPMMPNEADPEYETYKTQIAKEFTSLDGQIFLVGHSMGGTVLLRFLTQEKVEKPIAGIFLIAAPYWTAEDWFDEHKLHKNLAAPSHKTPPFFFYHSRDDPVVPFAHMAMYAAKLPQATIQEFDGRGHQFLNALPEVAADILSLS